MLVTSALLGLGRPCMLAVGLARRITRPLRRLTVAAGEVGRELPAMVERMQTPGEGPGVVVEPIPVESRDEIGRLAVAFNTVNEVTVEVAQEQAALRASIAEMFVNVARRNQVLLGRQLKALDQMEAHEADPDVLQRLFTLDHLATRMRRNAESLLVLAGIDSTRRLRSRAAALGRHPHRGRRDRGLRPDRPVDVRGRRRLRPSRARPSPTCSPSCSRTRPTSPTRGPGSSCRPPMTGHGVDVTVTDYGLGHVRGRGRRRRTRRSPTRRWPRSPCRSGSACSSSAGWPPGWVPPSRCAAAGPPAPSSPSRCPPPSSRA